MKIFLAVLFLFFSFNCVLFSQSSWQSYFLGQPNDPTAICFPSETTGYIFGIELWYKSTDGGDNWVSYQYPFKAIEAVFINITTGYVLAKSSLQADTTVVLKTTNGGINWNNYRLVKSDAFKEIVFINNSTGYIFSNGYVLNPGAYFFRTTNGGLSWVQKQSGFWQTMQDWQALNSTVWYSASDLNTNPRTILVYRSSNYGDSFSQICRMAENNQDLSSSRLEWRMKPLAI